MIDPYPTTDDRAALEAEFDELSAQQRRLTLSMDRLARGPMDAEDAALLRDLGEQWDALDCQRLELAARLSGTYPLPAAA